MLLAVLFLGQIAFCADFKVISANYDLSNNAIVIGARETTETNFGDGVFVKKLENPLRYYFDINSSILAIPKQDWKFQNSSFERVLISQFQNNPNIVRVVVYPKEGETFDGEKAFKFFRIANNLIIKINGGNIQNDYFQQVYRDEHISSSDFYENLKVVGEGGNTVNIANDIQKAFNVSTADEPKNEIEYKKFKLNTKYFLNKVNVNPNSVLLSGFGEITVEKPIILQNPTRLIYDFPNAISSGEVRNQEYQINETDKVVIGQFSINKVRAVIYTDNIEAYLPVISSDNQSVLIINRKTYNVQNLIGTCATPIDYQVKETDDLTQSLTIKFDLPIIHSIERKDNMLVLTVFNTIGFNKSKFNEIIAGSFFYTSKAIDDSGKAGLRISIPLRGESLVNTYLGADGKALKVVLKQLFKIADKNIPCKRIVIDAGHGGTDYGAIRGEINEKDIVLDVAKKVQKELVKQGHIVIMTRNDDTYISLQDRVDTAQNMNADIFVSIHVNSSVKPEIEGVETHYYRQESLELAQSVHEQLIQNLKAFDRGLFKSKFYVINHTEMPAILCEIGFISNEAERRLLISEKRKNQTAQAIVEGVLKYFGKE